MTTDTQNKTQYNQDYEVKQKQLQINVTTQDK